MAFAGFILAGAENNLRGGRKKSGGGRLAPEGRTKFSAPPAEFDFAPMAELTRGGGGQKTLLYLEKEGETFDNRSLSRSQLTVLFF